MIPSASGNAGANMSQQFFGQPPLLPQQHWDMSSNLTQPGLNIPQFGSALTPQSGPPPKKFYTFQRVNGNGGNGKGDGIAGPHKHTLDESDRVKKNSVLRWQAKLDKDDRRKAQVSHFRNLHCISALRSIIFHSIQALAIPVVKGRRCAANYAYQSSAYVILMQGTYAGVRMESTLSTLIVCGLPP